MGKFIETESRFVVLGAGSEGREWERIANDIGFYFRLLKIF